MVAPVHRGRRQTDRMAGAVSSLSFLVVSTAGFLLAGLATRSSLSPTHNRLFVVSAGSASAAADGGGGNIGAESTGAGEGTATNRLEGEAEGQVGVGHGREGWWVVPAVAVLVVVTNHILLRPSVVHSTI